MGSSLMEGEVRLCAAVSLQAGEQVLGTAPHHQRFLVVEVAEPWAGKLLASEHFPAALREAETAGLKQGVLHRLQGVRPDAEYSRPGWAMVLDCGVGPDAWRREYRVREGDVGALVAALLGTAGDLTAWADHLVHDGPQRDLLLCCHGEHDICCGRFGRELHQALRAAAGDGVRVWRTSHLGGHRFAPTLLDLPSGRYWGRVEPGHVPALLGDGPVGDLSATYRGWTALATPFEQVAEGELLRRLGRVWLAAPLECTVLDSDPAGGWARVHLSAGAPVNAAYVVRVETDGSVQTLSSSGDTALIEALRYRVSDVAAV